MRWNRREKGSPSEQEEEAAMREGTPEATEEERMSNDIMENMSREVYNPITKKMDFRKLRVTDMRDNPRVQLPGPRPPDEEKVLAAKEILWDEVIERYKVQMQ